MTLKAGLIGLGKMGLNHERVLRNLLGVELIAIHDSNSEVYTNLRSDIYKETLSDFFNSGIDYCVIASSSKSHFDLATLAAKHRIPILIEKPLALDSKSSHIILKTYNKLNLVAAVAHIERFNPVILKAKELLKNNIIGEILNVSTRRQNDSFGRVFDSGVIFDLATHDIDLTSWLTGEEFIKTSVVGHLNKQTSQEFSAAIVAKLTNGVTSSHLVSRLSTFKERLITITGTLGVLYCNTLNSELKLHLRKLHSINTESKIGDAEVITFELLNHEPLMMEHENFRDALMSGSKNYCSLSEGHKIVEIAEQLSIQLRSSLEK